MHTIPHLNRDIDLTIECDEKMPTQSGLPGPLKIKRNHFFCHARNASGQIHIRTVQHHPNNAIIAAPAIITMAPKILPPSCRSPRSSPP